MVKLLVVKILCMVGVFFFMLLGSLLPVKIIETDFEKAHRSKKILSLCNTFGGGVFLATCFNALLPAVREKVRVPWVVSAVLDTLWPMVSDAISTLTLNLVESLTPQR
uniref:Solute carrier family 39 member 3 n=1 Tax=Molossus molossus TaxID=27622 RepID=A0A7J8ICR9_MOLMO|nr:solute carrier family 39 member 3 [Molossus molossus]